MGENIMKFVSVRQERLIINAFLTNFPQYETLKLACKFIDFDAHVSTSYWGDDVKKISVGYEINVDATVFSLCDEIPLSINFFSGNKREWIAMQSYIKTSIKSGSIILVEGSAYSLEDGEFYLNDPIIEGVLENKLNTLIS